MDNLVEQSCAPDSIIAELASDAWRDVNLRGLRRQDFEALGKYVGQNNVKPRLFLRLLEYIKRSDVKVEFQKIFFEGLDLKTIAEECHKRIIGIFIARRLLEMMQSLNIVKGTCKTFWEALDFKIIATQVTKLDAATPAFLVDLLRTMELVGVDTACLQLFCGALNFRSLGIRANQHPNKQETGVGAVTDFLRVLRTLEVSEASRKTFCKALEFSALASQANEGKCSYRTVLNFMWETKEMNLAISKMDSFTTLLNWYRLGCSAHNEEMFKTQISMFRAFLSLYGSVITQQMCREFVAGVGWDHFKASYKLFTPDIFAAARTFFIKNCGYEAAFLAEKGLTWTPSEWLDAFVSRTCKRELIVEEWRQDCWWEAVEQLRTNGALLLLKEKKLDLKAWNFLINNLKVVDPYDIERFVTPVLKTYSISEFETLFYEADLDGIGRFFHEFNPHDGYFNNWQLPDKIDFKKINLKEKLAQSSLLSIAFFVFNFFYIQRDDCVHYFAEQLDKYHDLILHHVEQADLDMIGLFLWNWSFSMPENNRPSLIADDDFHQKVLAKARLENTQQELLGIIGTMHLFGYSIPQYFLDVINIEKADDDCKRVSAKSEIKLFSMLGGLLAVSNGNLSPNQKRMYLLSVRKCEQEKLGLALPLQKKILRRLKGWLF